MRRAAFRKSRFLVYAFLLMGCFFHMGFIAEAQASQILVAVASNFHSPLKEIARQFEKETGNEVQISPGSTGKLYAQIIHGAPYELFLAADSRRPQLLEEQGQTLSGTRFTYALGQITLWSPDPNAIKGDGKSTLQRKNFKHIAMANPRTAPYGMAALQTIQKFKLWDEIRPLVVQGENIGQTFQFVASQNAELGFVALSQVLDPKNNQRGSRWDVPGKFYDPLRQDIVMLKNAEENMGAKALWKFLKGEKAQQIIKKYGYRLP